MLVWEPETPVQIDRKMFMKSLKTVPKGPQGQEGADRGSSDLRPSHSAFQARWWGQGHHHLLFFAKVGGQDFGKAIR